MSAVNLTSQPQMPVMLCVRLFLYTQISRWCILKLVTASKQSLPDEGHMEIQFWTVCSRGGRMENSSPGSFQSPFFIGQFDSVLIPSQFKDCYLDLSGSLWGSQSLWWSSPAQSHVWIPLSPGDGAHQGSVPRPFFFLIFYSCIWQRKEEYKQGEWKVEGEAKLLEALEAKLS